MSPVCVLSLRASSSWDAEVALAALSVLKPLCGDATAMLKSEIRRSERWPGGRLDLDKHEDFEETEETSCLQFDSLF